MREDELQRINDLTIKYVTRTITPAEQIELDQWLDSDPINRERFEKRGNIDATWEGLALLEEGDLRGEKLRSEGILPKDNSPIYRRKRIKWQWYSGVAAVLLLAVVLIYLFERTNHVSIPLVSAPVDLPPGGNRAVLVLADGTHISLDSAHNGALAHQGASQVVKVDAGQLAYKPGANLGEVGYNTILTPAGGQYQVTLPDRSVVWLNAASSIRFPTVFAGQFRSVEITGEAYFDVAQNASHPFIVQSGDAKIKVLGTRFNIKAYKEEKSTKATLLDGSIAVSTNTESVALRPGQQAIITSNIQVQGVDTTEVSGWKEGYFLYNGADIETVMRDISRWYGVDVQFEGSITNKKLSAHLSRNRNVSDVLEALQASGYHFKIEGRKTIRVLP